MEYWRRLAYQLLKAETAEEMQVIVAKNLDK
jgi:hypothetical protein